MNTTTISKSDIELLIEQKLMELLGDPDSGLEIRAGFLKKLKKRLRENTRRISHKKILAKYGKH